MHKLAKISFAYLWLLVFACIVFNAYLVFFEVKAFWLDEWCIIYNLKFTDPGKIWGTLAQNQQFPRLYLYVYQWFTQFFDYSYTALRIVPFLVQVTAIGLFVSLMFSIYANPWIRCLAVTLFLSSQTVLHYFVQTKHYSMESLASVVALGQLMILRERASTFQKCLCGFGFFIFPLVSYTYPIVVVPLLCSISLSLIFERNLKVFPIVCLLLIAAGIALAYLTDIHQVLSDHGMANYWGVKKVE